MMLSPPMLKTSMTLTMFLLLLMASMFSKKMVNKKSLRKFKESEIAKLMMKILASLSVMKLVIFVMSDGMASTTSIIPWIKKSKMQSCLSMTIDENSIFFSTVALIVTWSMVEFSSYYMHKDPNVKKFFRLLLMFLLKMLMLTSAKKIFLFFMGWEGVGFLSFLLISWWSTRKKAKSSALQAIMYKRMGDMGMMMFLSSVIMLTKSWKIKSMTSMKKSLWMKMLLFSCLFAAMGKSAQFGLHPWLPAAMEGPTPVSALLHSSTMVVAGIFLLMRVTSMTKPSQMFLKITLIMGALTAMFAATSAFKQHDMKKIIAYSTTSQLGLMMVAMGLGKPKMALFHMCTHAFFKAMLFLCSGSMIHSFKKEQDLRKMSKIKEKLPITTSCLLLGSMALMGIPFLSGFYSKDLILELIMENPQNLMVYFLAIMATLLTATYSFRMITFCFHKAPKKSSMKPMNEEKVKLYFPLIRLALGSIIMGWMLSSWFMKTPSLIPMNMVKITPLIVTMLGASMASSMMIFSSKKNMPSTFFTKTWFYTKIMHTISSKMIKKTALTAMTRTLDRGWKETSGGQGMFSSTNEMSKAQKTTQTGYMKQYLLSISLLSFLIFSILLML